MLYELALTELAMSSFWQPAAEITTSHVFAFGKHWANMAGRLDLPTVARLGADGEPYGSPVLTRCPCPLATQQPTPRHRMALRQRWTAPPRRN